MSSTVIKVENLAKQYRLGNIGTGTLSHDINKWWHKVRGKENPYLRVGEVNDRTAKGDSEYVWALQDINFEVKQGEVLGIIGRNGAGKSTLLKILSRTTAPTLGRMRIKGRVASLLEVGTGFHPELTGRENVYLNGAIMGMTKREITQKFDEIVDFAGVERYIDTPVKRYSSGMYVRLAFGVAAHLEPEILIVDEVLAVGDAEFQKKCLGKMKDVSVTEGRTVLFVSHNLSAIENLCNKCICMRNGKLAYEGSVEDGLNFYNSANIPNTSLTLKDRKDRGGSGNLRITKFFIQDCHGKKISTLKSGESYQFVIDIENKRYPQYFQSVVASIAFADNSRSQTVLLVRTSFSNDNFNIGSRNGRIICQIDDLALAGGQYNIRLFLGEGESITIDFLDNVTDIFVEGGDFFGTGSFGIPGICKTLTRANWTLITE